MTIPFVSEAQPALPGHPRLLLTASGAEQVKDRLEQNPDMRAWLQRVREQAGALAAEPPVERVMEGRRLLSVSRETLRRVLLWGTLHRLDPDPTWADRARTELLAVCAFSDWNPDHFLDTAEMAAAVAIGYDWLYAELSPEDRAALEVGLLKHALKPGLEGGWWVKTSNNWNPVCHGGLSLAALAVAEVYPEEARAVLNRAREHIPIALAAYDPDGVHHESPSYWDYGTGYFILLSMGLQTALGDDWGLTAHEGLRKSFEFRLQVIGPTGDVFNYGDGNPGTGPLVFHPYIASETDRADWGTFFLRQAGELKWTPRDRFLPLPLFHWPDAEAESSFPPVTYIGHGAVELASFRTAWGDPDAHWIALRGGTINVTHAHMDLGSFVLEADGVRWASDLGMERAIYARTDAWGTGDNSLRWSFLRAGIYSHNTLVLDGTGQKTTAHCPIIVDGESAAILDLTPAYPGMAERITRRVVLEKDHFRITDTLEQPRLRKELRWQMVTGADIEIAGDGLSVQLRKDGKPLRILLRSPTQGARFSVEDLTPERPEENPNKGYRLLVLTWPAPLPDHAVVDIELIPKP